MMRLFALALLIACGGAAAQDCDPRPFPLTLSKADARMEKEGQKYPPEITRIKNGVIAYTISIALVGALYKTWLAYDFDRAIFIAVDGFSYDGKPPRPPKRPQRNQLFRYVKDDQLNRAEMVTVIKATPAQAKEVACQANRIVSVTERDNSPPDRGPLIDHVQFAFHVIRDGKRVPKEAPAARPLKDQLSRLLHTTLKIEPM